MEMFKFTLGWEQLDKVPEDERVLALMLGKLFNDISILGKLLLWVRVDENEIDIERHGRAAQMFMLLTFLAGKLVEGWELLGVQYFKTKLSATYHPWLGEAGQHTLDELKAYFSKDNVLRTTRRQHAFHYDPDVVREDYANVPREEPCDIFLSQPPSGNLFQVSEAVASGSLLRMIGDGDGHKGINTLVLDAVRISGAFQLFVADFMMAFLKRHWPVVPKETKIDTGKRPSIDSVSIPFLTE
jgi:hypothetical protein